MTRYVLGFAFDGTRQHVLLIGKQKPAWQSGRLNGIGGKCEPEDRNAWAAMQREFHEETGLATPADAWVKFATMESPLWHISCFATLGIDLHAARAPEGKEQPQVISVDALRSGVNKQPLSNLPWLVSLALDTGEIHGRPDAVHVYYASNLP